MTDQPTPTTAPTNDDPAPSPSTDEKPTETVEFWKAKAREQEKRAKANADAATRLAALEDEQKSEAEKAADRVAAAEQRAALAEQEALRFRIATRFGVSDEDADLFLTGTDEDTLTKQAERLAKRAEDAGKPRTPNPNPDQGRSLNGPLSNADLFAGAVGDLL